jgi:cytoskeleton protein RodZ
MNDVAEAQESQRSAEASAPTVPPWDQLRQAREQHDLTQSEVAKELKLDLRYVKALEEGKLDDLPEPVYTAGYIRAYAKLMGLSADDIVSAYASQESTSMPEITQAREKIPSRYRQVDNSLPKSFSVSHGANADKKSLRLLIIGLGVAVFLAISWQVVTNMEAPPESSLPQEQTSEDIPLPAAPADEPPVTASKDTVAKEEKTRTVELTLPGQKRAAATGAAGATQEDIAAAESLEQNAKQLAEITLSYTKDSWVDIRDATGKPLIRRLGHAGNSHTVEGVPPFNVVLGYTPGVTLEYNGEPYDLSRFHQSRVGRFVLREPPAAE